MAFDICLNLIVVYKSKIKVNNQIKSLNELSETSNL